MKNEDNTFEKLWGYKIVITDKGKYQRGNVIAWMILIAFALAFCIFSLVSVSAVDLNLNKTQTCELPMINLTGIACDSYWCTAKYNGTLIDGFCFNSTVNNVTNETLVNQTLVYNETLIYQIAYNASRDYANNNSLVNATLLITVKNGLLDGEENRTRGIINSYGKIESVVQTQPVPGWVWIALILGLGVIGIVVYKIRLDHLDKKELDFDHFREPVIKNSMKPTNAYVSPNRKPNEVRGNVKPQYKPLDPLKDTSKDLANNFDEDMYEEGDKK